MYLRSIKDVCRCRELKHALPPSHPPQHHSKSRIEHRRMLKNRATACTVSNPLAKHANSFQPEHSAYILKRSHKMSTLIHVPKRLWIRLFAEIEVVLLVGQKILTWVGHNLWGTVSLGRNGDKMWNKSSSWTWLTRKSNAVVQATQ